MRTALSLAALTALATIATRSVDANAQSAARIAAPRPEVLTATAVTTSPGFGDGYRVDSAQRTAPNSVNISVSFGGGCAPHDFVASYRTDATGIRISLRHDSHHDRCEALLGRRFTITLPANTPATTRIHVESDTRTIDL